ncbi:MAG: undecaprenyl/decaprenyl-phosphate alpha-N-acetylglucosaminyl 1-phosphate transferase [Ignavibacteriales bacterium]|nr:MAG: undecaprenyl/decaprenyl-phosphate alpha-N-acetylglucosaminyl 1-phosphate transferase [Ignavibacteriales bacterium]
MTYLLIFFSSLILTIFFTPYVISYFKKVKIVDNPGARKIHTEAIPRMGGIIIYFIVVISLFSYSSDLNSLRMVIFASTFIAICGIIDDMVGLQWTVKFFLQALSAGCLIFFLEPFFNEIILFGISFPYPFDHIVLGVFILGVINSINLLDGMDGLASGFSLFISLIVFAIAFSVNNTFLMVLTASLVGSLLGFLKFNAFPARIFLGDTGSLTLGFFLVLSAVLVTTDFNHGSLDLTFAVILLGVPIVDTLKVMVVRMIERKSPFLADASHLHHIILQNNIRHKTTVFIIQSFTLIYVGSAFYYVKYSKSIAVIAFILASLLLIFVKPLLKVILRKPAFLNSLRAITNIPEDLVSFYKKYFVPVSTIVMLILFVSLLPGKTEIGQQIILLLIIITLLLLSISFYQNLQTRLFSDVYVLINILIFISLTNLSIPLITDLQVNSNIIQKTAQGSFIVLFAAIIFFLLSKEKIFSEKLTLLSGIDLIMLVLISLATIIQNFIGPIKIDFLGANLILGFVIYLWYKIILLFNSSYTRYLFYMSFALPLLSLLLLYFS